MFIVNWSVLKRKNPATLLSLRACDKIFSREQFDLSLYTIAVQFVYHTRDQDQGHKLITSSFFSAKSCNSKLIRCRHRFLSPRQFRRFRHGETFEQDSYSFGDGPLT